MADVLGENFDLELQKLEDENYTEYVSAAGKTSGVANIYKTLKDIKHVMQQLDPKKTDGGETQDDVDRKDTYGDGRIYQHVLKCPVCGKEMKDTPTRTGVCSRACELTIKHDIGCPLKYWVYGHFHTHIREEFEGTDFILLDRDRPGRKKGETMFDLFEVR